MHTLTVTGFIPDNPLPHRPAASIRPGKPAARVTELPETARVADQGSDLDAQQRAEQADVTAATTGDRRAFERLYRTHGPRVFALCLRMTGDRVTAEELVQDVFVRAWQKLESFRGDSAFGTWLHRVAVNIVLSHRKKDGMQRDRTVQDDEVVAVAPTRAVHVGDRLDLEAAIAGLPQGARRIFVLHDVEGYTHEEIGDLLGITSGGSKAQLHRARMLLREALSK
jgi:RNA polymerase sigma-70 factor, ECF subfamily